MRPAKSLNQCDGGSAQTEARNRDTGQNRRHEEQAVHDGSAESADQQPPKPATSATGQQRMHKVKADMPKIIAGALACRSPHRQRSPPASRQHLRIFAKSAAGCRAWAKSNEAGGARLGSSRSTRGDGDDRDRRRRRIGLGGGSPHICPSLATEYPSGSVRDPSPPPPAFSPFSASIIHNPLRAGREECGGYLRSSTTE
jgi:hypothetical protein